MAVTNQRMMTVQIPVGVLAHLFMAADSGAFSETQLWGFTDLALRPYCATVTTQTNGADGNAAQAKQEEGAGRRTRQASSATNTKSQAPQGTRTRAARAGSRREQLISLIRDNPAGMNRGEILNELGLKGDKSGEMSVSNALTPLTKAGVFLRNGGRYCPGPNIGAVTQEQAQLADA